ncbi:hypothetical protein HDU98_002622 [Podochytrium sp. JEL0797]|nr:hypothetical protein HDU98_002622 [Podochytrium sp. JEL0797]
MVRAAFKLTELQMNTPITSFSPENWATPQTVTITADVGALDAAVNSIEVNIDAPCAVNIDRCTASYPFTHTDGGVNGGNGDGSDGVTCTINGDPIFTSFGGETFNFIGEGEATITTKNGVSVVMDSANWMATITVPATTITAPDFGGSTGLCFGLGDGNWKVPEQDDNIMGNFVKGSLSPFTQYLGPGVAMNVSAAIGFGPNDYTTCLAKPASDRSLLQLAQSLFPPDPSHP